MGTEDDIWARIERHAGAEFATITGRRFTYTTPGNYLRVRLEPEGHEVPRVLSRTNFLKATRQMPAAKPSDISERQGPSYTWAILMDPRIRQTDY